MIRSRLRRLTCVVALGAIACLAATAAAQPDYPPGTFRLTPRTHIDLQQTPVHIPPQFDRLPSDLSVNLPPGFTASVFAAFNSVDRPRFMAFDSNGVLHVANMDDDQIIALPDRDEDGVADEAIVAATDFSRPHSIAFHDGALYVGDRPQILRLRDSDGDLVYEEREVLVDDIPASGMHSTRTVLIDEQRGKMYLSVGLPCDLCRRNDAERGSVLEFNLDGSGRRLFATGVRNVIGMALHPETGQLWGTNNGHDREGLEAPPEWIDVIRDGGFYGIPLAYGYQVWADFTIPTYKDILPLTAADSARVASMERPVALMPAHSAPMGIHFYEHDHFPARYRNAAFVALHAGSAKLAAIEGYCVIALFSEPDGSNARYEIFLSGLQTGTDAEDIMGHPMGIVTDSEGRMYVSSDAGYPSDPGFPYILRIEHSPIVAEWADGLPDSIASGALLELDSTVRVARLAGGGGDPDLVADFSALGGPSELPLEPIADDVWRLRASFPVTVDRGLRTAALTVRQPSSPPLEVRLIRTLAVEPQLASDDLVVFDDALALGWNVAHRAFFEDRAVELAEDTFVYEGEVAASFPVSFQELDWSVSFRPEQPLDPVGYRDLRFAIHFGPFDRDPSDDFNLYIFETLIDLVGDGYVDITSKEWQVVEVPLELFGRARPLKEITFGGDFSRRFYIDDVRLLAGMVATAITDEQPRPVEFALGIAYPNPFNNSAVIPFRLGGAGEVTLTVYNLAGQRVTRLVDGPRAGGEHAVTWTGTDAAGRAVASGVYFYRLQSGSQFETRKLLLLR